MDFGFAFTYVFRDPAWVKKVLIGGLLAFIPIIGWAIILGYSLQIIRNVYEGNDSILPEWTNFGELLVSGIVAWVGAIIWSLPVIFLSSCVQLFLTSGDDMAGLGVIFSCLLFPVFLVYQVIFPPIVTARYAVNRTFGTMFEFNEIFQQVQRAGSALVILYLITLVAYFVGLVGLVACIVGVFFTGAYAGFVVAHATGQVYRKASGMTPQQPAF